MTAMVTYAVYKVEGGQKKKVKLGPYYGEFFSEEEAEVARKKLDNPDKHFIESRVSMG